MADIHAAQGYNYYRINSVDDEGKYTYSSIQKVLFAPIKGSIIIYPNPIRSGTFRLRFNEQQEGIYNICVFNNVGQPVIMKQLTCVRGNNIAKIKLGAKAGHGIYQVEITNSRDEIQIIKALY